MNGPGHCAECHSPRNALGGIVEEQALYRRPQSGRRGHDPEHHPARYRRVFREDIEEILASGTNPEGDNVGGSMAAVVRNTSQLPQSDRAAMAAYIKSLPPVQ